MYAFEIAEWELLGYYTICKCDGNQLISVYLRSLYHLTVLIATHEKVDLKWVEYWKVEL